ncbi:MAG: hypothetical protein EBX66_08800, partial [Betaproteobacteria bacterium]|nr:hypothetical protein [Betaproteobacteria bacterium]
MTAELEAFLSAALAWFALPQIGLSAVFITAFVSATLLPMGSEPVVFGYVKLHPDQFWLTIGLATLGITAAAGKGIQALSRAVPGGPLARGAVQLAGGLLAAPIASQLGKGVSAFGN